MRIISTIRLLSSSLRHSKHTDASSSSSYLASSFRLPNSNRYSITTSHFPSLMLSVTNKDNKEGDEITTAVNGRNISSSFSSSSSSSSSTTSNYSGVLSKRLNGLDAPTVWQEFSPLAIEHKSVNLGQGFPDWDPPTFVIEELKRSIDPHYEDTDTDTAVGGSSSSSSSSSAVVTNNSPNSTTATPPPTTTTTTTANQYARSFAHMPLAVALRNDYVQYQWKHSDLPRETLQQLDPATNIATATGVTNVLYCALQGLLNPGDEVVLLEPYFDIYASQVKMAGGVPTYCPLRPNKEKEEEQTDSSNPTDDTITNQLGASEYFTLDLEELASKLTSKTKVLIVNTPHNPTGKIFNQQELEGIAHLIANHNNNNNNQTKNKNKNQQIIVLSDEVYQHIIFDPLTEPHISIATVNQGQIWNHTLTMSSAGKTFACTGWKVGWAIGPSHLIKAVTAVQQWCNFSPVTPTQDAIARALVVARRPYKGYDSYYQWLAADYDQKRNLLIDALENAGTRSRSSRSSSSSNDRDTNNDDSDTDNNLENNENQQHQTKTNVFKAVIPSGGFFIMADSSNIQFPYEEIAATQVTPATPSMMIQSQGSEHRDDNDNDDEGAGAGAAATTTTTISKMPRDWALSRWLTTTVGVTAIPPSAFYSPENLHLASDTLRFAFCKNEETLLEASRRLEEYNFLTNKNENENK